MEITKLKINIKNIPSDRLNRSVRQTETANRSIEFSQPKKRNDWGTGGGGQRVTGPKNRRAKIYQSPRRREGGILKVF